ncbi:LysM domain-containing protein [Evansella sp. AB-P1]|uniref:LysM peptidoglycan-binding domain-containing protein n=1 Tax=Evansella sp. AB-P1 TaxID=3037653 RepID=UPI00241F4796|nr:LysM domain-containing protein [Evansella sp. AB-P1]MDG5788781.1 LysM domain-containing protein [Evansella sp. AB-P1]
MKKLSLFFAPILLVGMVFGFSGLSAMANTTTVEEGDTIWGYSQEHDVTVDELLELNSGIDPYALQIGSEIQLEPSEGDGNGNGDSNGETVTHVVQPGNTLSGIATVYDGVTVDHLLELNEDVDPRALTIGSEIVVVERDSTGDTTGSDAVYHTIQPGNTFTTIASVYDGVSAEDIEEANPDYDAHALPIGAQLVIPTS